MKEGSFFTSGKYDFFLFDIRFAYYYNCVCVPVSNKIAWWQIFSSFFPSLGGRLVEERQAACLPARAKGPAACVTGPLLSQTMCIYTYYKIPTRYVYAM